MIEYVYCAVNKNNDIQWVEGSSKKTRYFRTTRYLNNAVKYHNEYYRLDRPEHYLHGYSAHEDKCQ